MKFARSWAQGVLGVVAFLILVAVGMDTCDSRCRQNLEANEITWEEIVDQQRADAAKRGD